MLSFKDIVLSYAKCICCCFTKYNCRKMSFPFYVFSYIMTIFYVTWLCYLDLFIWLLYMYLLLTYICICCSSYVLLPIYLSCFSVMVLCIKRSELTLNVKGWSGGVLSLERPLEEVERSFQLLRSLLSSLRTDAIFHYCAGYFFGEFYLRPWKAITYSRMITILQYPIHNWR